MSKRVIGFVGSRDLDERHRWRVVRAVAEEVSRGAEIVTGDCPTGVDLWTREAATVCGVSATVFKPTPEDIKALGYRAALARRAERIADALHDDHVMGADVGIYAWCKPNNGQPTAGTARTINRAKKHGVPFRLYFPDDE